MARFSFLFLICLMVFSEGLGSAFAKEQADVNMGVSGLPIPRFVAINPSEANMRTGPGVRYPIEWVYLHESLPVEVTAEYDTWRRVRDVDGTEGWVHKSVLTGRRSGIVTGGTQSLKYKEDDQSATIAYLQKGSVGKLLSCEAFWCKLVFDGIEGYLPKTAFWGAYPQEIFD